VIDRSATRARAIVLSSIALLVGLIFTWQCREALTASTILRAFAFSLPALAPVHGLIQGNRRAYRWASLCVLPYFIVSVTEAFANPAARFWATSMLAIALLWFFASIAFIRATEADQ
jgi:uncharacterized membrane protein